MLDDSALAVILTLTAVTIVLLIDLRSVVDTLLVLTPLLTALIWVMGFMYAFDIRLNLYNMVAFPTIIGMGIDNGVHVFHRYREAGKGSLRLVLRTTGMALFATSLTTMVGFSGLVPAHHPALSSIGVLSLVGLGCCFITSVTLLPALLQLRERHNA
jgi:predicted RND superfamily exporter protein